MTNYFVRRLDAMNGGAPWARDVLPCPAGQIRGRFRGLHHERVKREQNLRLEERRKERAHIARELHDTLFQGFLGASMLLHSAVEQLPADSPSRPSINRALNLMSRVIDEGRGVLQGLRSPEPRSSNLEQELCRLGEEFAPRGARFQIFVTGRPRPLKPAVREQIGLIAREALVNALRHSGATSVEAEIEYAPEKLRVMVRDNGSGFDTQALKARCDSHWGLVGMRERASGIGAQLSIWSRPGAGTEVEVCVADGLALAEATYGVC
jgi:signal transduction histidine kinase